MTTPHPSPADRLDRPSTPHRPSTPGTPRRPSPRHLLKVDDANFRKISMLSNQFSKSTAANGEEGGSIGGGLTLVRYASRWMARVGMKKRGKHSMIMDLMDLESRSRSKVETYDELRTYMNRRRTHEISHHGQQTWERLMEEVRAQNVCLMQVRAASAAFNLEGILQHYQNQEHQNLSYLRMVLEQDNEICILEREIGRLEVLKAKERAAQQQKRSAIRRALDTHQSALSQSQAANTAQAQELARARAELQGVCDRVKGCMETAQTDMTSFQQKLGRDGTIYDGNMSITLKELENNVNNLLTIIAYFQHRNAIQLERERLDGNLRQSIGAMPPKLILPNILGAGGPPVRPAGYSRSTVALRTIPMSNLHTEAIMKREPDDLMDIEQLKRDAIDRVMSIKTSRDPRISSIYDADLTSTVTGESQAPKAKPRTTGPKVKMVDPKSKSPRNSKNTSVKINESHRDFPSPSDD